MVTPNDRRNGILRILSEADRPISATVLANQFNVSRQVIVGDIALLRASGNAVDATPRGYVIGRSADNGYIHHIVVNHTGEQMADELNTIIDSGSILLNISIEHPVYGELAGELRISSHFDVSLFIERMKSADALPLSSLTDGVHSHLVSCPDEATFQRLTKVLQEKGYLLSAN